MSTKAIEVTSKNFERFLADTLKSASSIRGRWQALAEFALQVAFETERDFSALGKVYGAMRGCQGTDHKRMLRYLCASLPVVYREGKTTDSGKDIPAGFIKRKDSTTWEMTKPECSWWEYETVKTEKASKPLDVNRGLTKLLDNFIDHLNTRGEIKVDRKILLAQIAKLQELADRIG